MKLHYYSDTDSLYVELKAGPGTETREVAAGLNVDLDANGTSSALTSTMRQNDSIFPRWRQKRCRCGPIGLVKKTRSFLWPQLPVE